MIGSQTGINQNSVRSNFKDALQTRNKTSESNQNLKTSIRNLIDNSDDQISVMRDQNTKRTGGGTAQTGTDEFDETLKKYFQTYNISDRRAQQQFKNLKQQISMQNDGILSLQRENKILLKQLSEYRELFKQIGKRENIFVQSDGSDSELRRLDLDQLKYLFRQFDSQEGRMQSICAENQDLKMKSEQLKLKLENLQISNQRLKIEIRELNETNIMTNQSVSYSINHQDLDCDKQNNIFSRNCAKQIINNNSSMLGIGGNCVCGTQKRNIGGECSQILIENDTNISSKINDSMAAKAFLNFNMVPNFEECSNGVQSGELKYLGSVFQKMREENSRWKNLYLVESQENLTLQKNYKNVIEDQKCQMSYIQQLENKISKCEERYIQVYSEYHKKLTEVRIENLQVIMEHIDKILKMENESSGNNGEQQEEISEERRNYVNEQATVQILKFQISKQREKVNDLRAQLNVLVQSQEDLQRNLSLCRTQNISIQDRLQECSTRACALQDLRLADMKYIINLERDLEISSSRLKTNTSTCDS